MKLSLSKRFGWIQCRGGQLLRVAKEHAVPSSGRSSVGTDYDSDLLGRPKPDGPPPSQSERWVTTQEGDLAVEIVAVKTGATLGHSYLSGQAIQLNRYTPAQEDWFRPATGRLIEIPDPHAWEGKREEFFTHCIELLMGVRYGKDDLGAFEYQASTNRDAQDAARSVAEMWSYEPVDEEPVVQAHLLGMFYGTKGFTITAHFQPPKHTSDYSATGFQIGLVLSALRYAASKAD